MGGTPSTELGSRGDCLLCGLLSSKNLYDRNVQITGKQNMTKCVSRRIRRTFLIDRCQKSATETSSSKTHTTESASDRWLCPNKNSPMLTHGHQRGSSGHQPTSRGHGTAQLCTGQARMQKRTHHVIHLHRFQKRQTGWAQEATQSLQGRGASTSWSDGDAPVLTADVAAHQPKPTCYVGDSSYEEGCVAEGPGVHEICIPM